jgi:replication factor C subunit 3/5
MGRKVQTSHFERLNWAGLHRQNKYPSTITQKVQKFIKERNLPNLLFYGPPGTGKTSTMIACAKELYGAEYKMMVLEVSHKPKSAS